MLCLFVEKVYGIYVRNIHISLLLDSVINITFYLQYYNVVIVGKTYYKCLFLNIEGQCKGRETCDCHCNCCSVCFGKYCTSCAEGWSGTTSNRCQRRK